MTGKTPKYGIPYPDGTTKANKLGDELAAMGLGVEAALEAAGVPSATNPDRVVANSDAARDAYFGKPSLEADRLALQRRGAECVRPDKGWTERYYATYNANTNPFGTPVAGWYPVAGQLPIVRVGKNVSQNTSPNVGTYVPITYEANTFDPNGMHSTVSNTSRMVAPVGGYYRAFGQVRINTSGSANIMLAKNGVGIGDSLWALNISATVFPSTEDVIYLNAGDYIEVWAASSAANAPVPTGHATMAYLRP